MSITNGGLVSASLKRTITQTNALSDGLACFTGSFSGVTTTSIGHNLNSTDIVVEFKDSLGNLLIPDTWSITNPNVIEAEFTPAATGDVTIIACIESGLAPITGGVVLLEGLSGIIDLDCPDGSVDISTSGQVINICSIFTPTSGALLEQKCRDIDTLSGLIGGGGSDTQTSINGLSGVVQLVSPNDGIVISESGNTIFVSGLYTSASGAIIDQKCRDIETLSGLLGTGGVTSIEGLSGIIDLDSQDGSILIGTSGQTIFLSGLFTSTSGALLEQKCRDIDTLSGLIGASTAGVTDVNGLSGSVIIKSANDAMTVTTSGNSICLEVQGSGLSLSGIVDNVAGVSAALQTTTSKTLIEALSLPFNIAESGTYKISWSMEGSCNNANKECQFVVELDNTDTLMDIQTSFNVAAGNLPFAGFAQREIDAGSHFVDVDFRYADTGVQVAELERIGLEIWRLR